MDAGRKPPRSCIATGGMPPILALDRPRLPLMVPPLAQILNPIRCLNQVPVLPPTHLHGATTLLPVLRKREIKLHRSSRASMASNVIRQLKPMLLLGRPIRMFVLTHRLKAILRGAYTSGQLSLALQNLVLQNLVLHKIRMISFLATCEKQVIVGNS